MPIDRHALSVKDQLVLTADQVHVGDGAVGLKRSLAEHRLAVFATPARVRRCVRHDEQRRAGLGQLECRSVAGPHVFADEKAHGDAPYIDDRLGTDAGVEVAPLVKDVVVRQEPLGRGRDNTVVGESDQHVRDVSMHRRVKIARRVASVARRSEMHAKGAIGHGRANKDRWKIFGFREIEEGLGARFDEAFLQEEVLRRIAHQGEFRREHEVGANKGRLSAKSCEGFDVLAKPTHYRVHLGEGDSQRGHDWSLTAFVLRAQGGYERQRPHASKVSHAINRTGGVGPLAAIKLDVVARTRDYSSKEHHVVSG